MEKTRKRSCAQGRRERRGRVISGLEFEGGHGRLEGGGERVAHHGHCFSEEFIGHELVAAVMLDHASEAACDLGEQVFDPLGRGRR